MYAEDYHYYFNGISVNNFTIDFFAGNKSCCEPKGTFNSLLHYKKIQIYIREDVRGIGNAIRPTKDDRFAGFDWAKYFVYINSNGRTSGSYMGEYIPIEEAYQLIRDVYKVSRLKVFF